ncbi:MAG: MerR family transcriptional regulator [Vicinamibacterales bacterium]|nr:MerR family transcriptional regulator [Vicinamibacterales bacterium]
MNALSPQALAHATGVSVDTLRHYERKGVLPVPPRTAGGFRRYPPEAVDRVRLVQRALTIGFSLDELARLLAERDRGGAPCRRVLSLLETRFAEFDARVRTLTALRRDLRRLMRDWHGRLEHTPAGAQARLLDLLAGRPAVEHARASRRRTPPTR